ncbi:MAG: sentrin/sumo protease [Mycoplasmataceae bacterium RV_VA103A]|nr:MAG: sentrin/sumo protease [Mycoplasmataceae bacterium RV_VA103A]
MVGTIILVLIIILLLLGIIWFSSPSQPKKNKPTEEVNDWEREKEQAKREAEAEHNKEWFKEGRWLTDKEIDWAGERMEKDERVKFLPAYQFHLVKEAKRTTDSLIFKELLKEINDSNKELIFIPVNNPNYHWSLLVYQVKEKKFWHYDTLGGANHQYVKPLVKELLEQIRQVQNIKEEYLGRYLVKKHGIRQNNGSDFGVAVIAIVRRVIELKFKQNWRERLKYGKFRMGDDLGRMDFRREQEELRRKYLEESN